MTYDYDSVFELLDSTSVEITKEIYNAIIKSWSKIHRHETTAYSKIMISVSGGADSDLMIDLIERVGYPSSRVHYVFFDTGLEFNATRRHLEYLEEKYGIKIEKYKAKVPVPLGVKKYGSPFLSKQVSQFIMRLQKHNFKWEDKPFEELYKEYPRCKSALRWWCNEWGEGSRVNISNNKYLKEFIIKHPPSFKISDGCCKGAKKDTSKMIEKDLMPDLICIGIRKSEGGARSTAYKNCFTEVFGGCDQFRPIFFFKKEDKKAYEKAFQIVHSKCYTKYGLLRTGCACCPYGKDFEKELLAAQTYESNLYKAANNIFKESYEYTRKYKEFCKHINEEKSRGGTR